MNALTAGSENKTGQDTVSYQAGGRACTEGNLSKNNNVSERLFSLIMGIMGSDLTIDILSSY